MQQFDRFDVWGKLQPDLNHLAVKDYRKLVTIATKKNLFKFLFVRHPLRRIYSAYHDKFNNTSRDAKHKYWVHIGQTIMKRMNKSNEDILDFRTFLLFIVDSIRYGRKLNSHWDIIYNICSICLIDYDFIGKIENMAQDGPTVLARMNVSHRIRFPSWKLDDRDKKMMTDEEITQLFRKTLASENDFQVLIGYFLPDFQAFNYPVPSITRPGKQQ
jgi:carbohydrate 4-sulfotransferase 8